MNIQEQLIDTIPEEKIHLASDLDKKQLRRIIRRSKGIPANYKEDESQEVYPFKDMSDIIKMAKYYTNNQQWRNYTLLMFGINVGLRAGDLLNLKWSNVLDENQNIVDNIIMFEHKTKKKRSFFLNNGVKKALQFYMSKIDKTVGYIFNSQKGDVLTVRAANAILKKAAKEVGIQYNVGTHSLRKTFCYHQFLAHNKDNMFLAELQDMFGHSSPKLH
jgi:integrase